MFTEYLVPLYMFIRPLVVEFGVSKVPPRPARTEQVREVGWSWTQRAGGVETWLSGRPCSRAAASVKALNVEPAWNPLASPYSDGTV